jgi:hypothetical protein
MFQCFVMIFHKDVSRFQDICIISCVFQRFCDKDKVSLSREVHYEVCALFGIDGAFRETPQSVLPE